MSYHSRIPSNRLPTMPFETGSMKMNWERTRAETGRMLLPLLLIVLAVALLGHESTYQRWPALISVATAQEDWKQEFESICAMTQDAMALSKDELSDLVERCDKLKSRIDQLDESSRKVYRKRLQLCRDLYAYALQYKRENEE